MHRFLCALGAGFSTGAVAIGSPTIIPGSVHVNPANGNAYALLNSDTWTASQAFAVSAGGTLATITDVAEQEWIVSTFSEFGGIPRAMHIGLLGDDAGVFAWVTGEPVAYTNWALGEPNFLPDDRYTLILPPNPDAPGKWNNDLDRATGFYTGSGFSFGPFDVYGLIEVVPSPGALALLAPIGLSATRRPRR